MNKKERGSPLKVLIFIFMLFVFIFLNKVEAQGINVGNSPVLRHIVDTNTIRVGVNPLFKPFSFINNKNERTGIDIDIAKLLASELGVKLK